MVTRCYRDLRKYLEYIRYRIDRFYSIIKNKLNSSFNFDY